MKIANIAIIVKLNTSTIDLDKIHDSIGNTEFTSQASRWLKMRLVPENFYVALYRSGKYSITGIKSVEQIEDVANRVLSLLRGTGFQCDIESIEINAMVFIGSVQRRVHLENLMCNLDVKKASYEPEQFPALIYRDFGVAFLLFSTGKVIITGCKSQDEAETALNKLINVIGLS